MEHVPDALTEIILIAHPIDSARPTVPSRAIEIVLPPEETLPRLLATLLPPASRPQAR